MLLISAESRKRAGAAAGEASSGGRPRGASFSTYSPGSAGASFSSSSRSQPGWVKSPVPMTASPFRRAQASRCSGVRFRLVETE